jgi:hypothetical protein
MNTEDEIAMFRTLEHILLDARDRATKIEDLERQIDSAMQAGKFILPLEHVENMQDAKADVREVLLPIEAFFEAEGLPVPDPQWERPEWLADARL